MNMTLHEFTVRRCRCCHGVLDLPLSNERRNLFLPSALMVLMRPVYGSTFAESSEQGVVGNKLWAADRRSLPRSDETDPSPLERETQRWLGAGGVA